MRRRIWLAVPCLAAALGGGCGGEQDIGEQNHQTGLELFGELESAADGTEYATPTDVACTRPKPRRFLCRAYHEVRSDVALFAEYLVLDCGEGLGWRARRVSGTDDFPPRLRYDPDPETTGVDCG